MHETTGSRNYLMIVDRKRVAFNEYGGFGMASIKYDRQTNMHCEQDLGSLTSNNVPPLPGQELLETTGAHFRPLIPQIASAVFATSSKEPVSPLARATNIAPSSAETNSFAFPLAAEVWAPALSKTRISQSSFARKNSRTSAETSVGTPSTSAPIIPQRHMRPPESAARNKRT